MKEAHTKLMSAFVDAINEVQSSLPSVVGPAVSVANQYLEGSATEQTLTSERVRLWSVIKGRDCSFSDPFVCAVRLAICAVTLPVDDLEMSRELFDDMWARLALDPDVLEKALG